jgi:lysophospholipase L1-like esterase
MPKIFAPGVLLGADGLNAPSPKNLASYPVMGARRRQGMMICPSGVEFSVPALPLWSAAVRAAQAGTRDARILPVGDSTTVGAGALGNGYVSNDATASTPTVLAGMTFGGVQGSWQSLVGTKNLASGLVTYDHRITLDAGATVIGASIGATGLRRTGVGAMLTFTPTEPVSRFKVYYERDTGEGVMGLSVNGGAVTNVTNTGAAAFMSVTFDVPLGMNTLTISTVSGARTTVHAVEASNPAVKRVQVLNAGWYGVLAGGYALSTAYFSPLNVIDDYAPDLGIIDLGINDWNQVTPTTEVSFKASIQAFIDAFRAAGADVILVVPVPSGTANGIANQGLFQTYIHDLGTLNNVPVVDMIARWGSYAAKNALGWYRDTLHPTSLGYADKALAISEVIRP